MLAWVGYDQNCGFQTLKFKHSLTEIKNLKKKEFKKSKRICHLISSLNSYTAALVHGCWLINITLVPLSGPVWWATFLRLIKSEVYNMIYVDMTKRDKIYLSPLDMTSKIAKTTDIVRKKDTRIEIVTVITVSIIDMDLEISHQYHVE